MVRLGKPPNEREQLLAEGKGTDLYGVGKKPPLTLTAFRSKTSSPGRHPKESLRRIFAAASFPPPLVDVQADASAALEDVAHDVAF